MVQNNEQPRIVFEGDQLQRPQPSQAQTPKIIQWVIRYSRWAIKDEKQANYFLVWFVVLAIIVSLFLFFGTSLSTSTNKTTIDKTIKLHSDLLKQ